MTVLYQGGLRYLQNIVKKSLEGWPQQTRYMKA